MPKNWGSFSFKLAVLAFVFVLVFTPSACGRFTPSGTENNESTGPLDSENESAQTSSETSPSEAESFGPALPAGPEIAQSLPEEASSPEDVSRAVEQLGLYQEMPYAEARERILQQGWQPYVEGTPPNLDNSTIRELFDLGYEEIADCSGTGMGFCRFEFVNGTGAMLVLSTTTMGTHSNADRVVWLWFLVDAPNPIQANSSSAEQNSSSSNPSDASQMQLLGASQIQLSLAGIPIGATQDEVINQLGQPTQVVDSLPFPQLEYPGLTVWFDENRQGVLGMLSTSDQYCTPAGVCPGMDVAEVREIYGEPQVSDREDGRFIEYYPDTCCCWLQIALENDETVRSIEVLCAM